MAGGLSAGAQLETGGGTHRVAGVGAAAMRKLTRPVDVIYACPDCGLACRRRWLGGEGLRVTGLEVS